MKDKGEEDDDDDGEGVGKFAMGTFLLTMLEVAKAWRVCCV